MTVSTVFQAFLLVIIAWLTYNVINMIMEASKRRKFVIKDYLPSDKKEFSILEKATSFNKYKRHLEKELREAHSTKRVETFIAQRVLSIVISLFLMIVLYKISNQQIFLYLVIPVMFFVYKIPKKILSKAKHKYELQMKHELPDYLYHFAVLLDSHTPFEATNKSSQYASGLLKPYVDELVTQINLYPASSKPYYEFAEKLNIREAREFVAALEQIIKVDSKSASSIISNQISIMNDLQEEAYRELVELRPQQTEPYVNWMLIPFILIILSMVAILIGDTFSTL